MARAQPVAIQARSVREVLAAGGRLFAAGLASAFPWVLVAELTQLVPNGANQSLDISTMDVGSLFQGDDILRTLFLGALQALCYGFAVLRLAALTGESLPGFQVWHSVRAVPSVFIGYLVYSLIVILGLAFSLMMFLNILPLGVLPALAVTLILLAPTAVISTALALFIYPAVLEKRGPFTSLGESARLAKSSWARTTVVISVPALALMCVWAITNGTQLVKLISAIFAALDQLQEGGMGMTDLQNQIMSAVRATENSSEIWRIFTVILGAIVWWYTLSVCYAEYRALKERDSVSTKDKKNH